MRVMFVAPRFDYGQPERGLSFEHYNFYETLHGLGFDVVYFDFPTLLARHGRDGMNRRLHEVVRAERPDLLFTVLSEEQLDRTVMRSISDSGATITLNWFCDDHWRFEGYTRHWAPCFNWSVTTAASAMPKYERLGYRTVIKSQWACNPFRYRRLDLPPELDVSFVGQPHGIRRDVIAALRDAGIRVQTYGAGWDTGRCSQEDLIRIFNTSRINLNLSNSCPTVDRRSARVARGLRASVSRALATVPYGDRMKAWVKRSLPAPPPAAATPAATGATVPPDLGRGRYHQQIKGRVFEVPACGGLLLTDPADNLDAYYRTGEELACFEDFEQLVERIRFLLANEDTRRAIADAGYERTMREHTYVHRFEAIFRRIGLPWENAAPAPHAAARGETLEIQ